MSEVAEAVPLSLPRGVSLAVRLARRGLRGGARGLWGALLCLALGVAAIGGIGSLEASLTQGLANSGRALLGGDLEVETGGRPVPATLREWFESRGARISEVVSMHAMLVAPSGKRELVSLLAVDRAWPLVGQPVLAPATDVGAALEDEGIVAAPLALQRLGLRPGDAVTLGRARFTIRAALVSEPGEVARPSLLGPPALIGMHALAATGLVQPGSLVRHALKVVLPAGARVSHVEAALQAAFPDSGWRVRDAAGAAPGLSRFLDRTGLFMTLVALTALMVAGIGVVGGVANWAEARLPTIAALKALGASQRLVAATLVLQILALAAGGIVAGLIVGAALTPLIVHLFGADLPVPAALGIYPGPLLLAGAFGLVTAILCLLWPITRAARVSGAALFRQPSVSGPIPPSPALLAASAVLVAALLGLAVVATGSPRFVALYAAAAAISLAALAGAGRLMMRAAAALGRRARVPWLKLGLADLHRPGAETVMMTVSIGLGLAALGAVALIEGNLEHALLSQIPESAPSFYFIDIQNDELAKFRELMTRLPGVEASSEVPMMRARIVAVNGVAAARVRASPNVRWALRADLGLTYAARPPPGTEITAGRWWPPDYRGPPLVSLDARLAAGLGVGVGDVVAVNVLGRDIPLRVTSLRHIVWQRLGLNFFLVASPGLLSGAPQTHIATVRAARGEEDQVLAAVTDALPTVSAITVADVLAAVAGMFGQIAAALAALGGLALAAGVLVLAGAVASEQRRRIRQAVVLKTLGATSGQIRAAWLVGFAARGAVAGLIAAALASAASFGVVRFLMGGSWVFLPAPLAETVLGAIVVLLFAGTWGTGAALRARAAPWLRGE
ncbi:MAG: ABC transporter permease [Acetobacteraceae bacterium]